MAKAMQAKKEYKPEDNKRITFENVRLVYRNFSRNSDPWNERPTASFGVILDESVINVPALIKDDWYIRYMKPKEDDPEQYRQPWMKVNLKMDAINPPTIELVVKGKRIPLKTEKAIEQLDFTRIKYADCIVRSYRYDPAKPMSAWLIDLRIVAKEADNLDSKYNDIPFADDEEGLPFE